MKRETRSEIKGYLEGFITGLLEDVTKTEVKPRDLRPITTEVKPGYYKPFHQALLPEGILRSSEFERKFSSRLGGSFEESARLISLGAGHNCERGYRLKGEIYESVFNEIGSIANELRETGAPEDFPSLVERVRRKPKSGGKRPIQLTLDLFTQIKRTKYFFEIKSPKPNKGQCLEVLERLLRIHAILDKSRGVKTYYAMPYNPYGEKRSDYDHWVGNFLDMDNMVLLGREFWDLLGGAGTYKALLSIYSEVGREKGPDVVDRLLADY